MVVKRRETDRQTDSQKQPDRQTDIMRHTGIHGLTCIQVNTQADIGRQTDRDR